MAENGNGNGQVKNLVLWVISGVALAAAGVNTGITATNPMGERVRSLETDMVSVKADLQQRAAMWSDVGEIKSDMRHVRGDLAELKEAVKELGKKP